jgi:uncharacterized protein YbjT (DUF2867 family)
VDERRLLLTGATGFVGGAVRPALEAAGWRVRALTRERARAAQRQPEVDWVEGDVADESACSRALDGCEAALYLVHAMGDAPDFVSAERRAAEGFARAAARAGLRRIVYLGGIAPRASASEHLSSRLEVGAVLRAGAVPTIELRASMIVGHGSLSWLIVRDLAARLPVMVLPAWLRSRTQPVAIDDVERALVGALDVPAVGSACFDLPGPEMLTGRELLDQTARVMGLRPALKVELPVLTPRLSSLWVRFVTRAQWSVARHVVLGLETDLLARDESFWTLIEAPPRLPFAEAARRALAAGEADEAPGIWGGVERLRRRRSRSVATPVVTARG